MYALAWLGDRYRYRGPVIVFLACLGIIGTPILVQYIILKATVFLLTLFQRWAEAPGVRYFGIFLICCTANGGIPAVMAYQANNIRGQWKRAFASATLVGFGGIGGIAGSTIFRAEDAPVSPDLDFDSRRYTEY